MKRLLTSAALFLCSLLTFAQFSGSGAGTESDPYLILNPIQLNQLRNFLNQSGVYFKLMADIDLTEFLEDENPDQGWQPVGTSSAPFKGILDGNGKTISGLWINRSNTSYVGLFGYCKDATIKNLTIKDAEINGKTCVGVISGYNYNYNKGGVSNCILSGKVNGVEKVGGCTGYTYNGFFNGISSSVDIIGGDYTGGIAGGEGGNTVDSNVHSITISNCFVNSTISGINNVGGILGGVAIGYCKISNCGYVGSISGTSNVGGICGYANYSYSNLSGTIKGSYAVAYVRGTGENTGGLIGYSQSPVEDCYFSGRVIGQKYTGGLIGYSIISPVKKCYSQGSIIGTSYVGGLCGYIGGSSVIQSNVIIASSIKATEGNVGRLYGYNNSSGNIGSLGTSAENKSYNRTIVINQGVAQDVSDDLQNGQSVSATTLKLKATYVAMGWNFTNTWAIQETECYPYFKRQTAPPVITSQVVSGTTTVSGKCVDGGTITLDVDGVKQQMVSTDNTFSFTVSPLQAGHEVRVSAEADGKEPSYFTTEMVSFLGKGTEADPYQISTAADLTQVYRKGYYKLMNDIDLTNYINQFYSSEGWESIGRDGSETIYFDGNNHKVTGLWCNSTRNNTGLFSCFAKGYIKNLTVETANGKQVKGGANTGIMIGKMINGTIENCRVAGNLSDGTPVGGVVGLMVNGTISKCRADVTINTTGATSYVGGLVGEITAGQIDQCFTTGTLTATGTESYVGGLIGKNKSTVTNSYSSAVVSSSYNAAGLVAYNYSVVDKCYAFGNLYSNNYAAGVIGYNDGANAVVKNCAAMNDNIDVVYESQQVQQGGGYGQRIIGGIKNGAPAPELNNNALNTMQLSVNGVAQTVYDDIMNGVAKTLDELTNVNTYEGMGWDFASVWGMSEDSNYPKLQALSSGNTGGGDTPGGGDEPQTESLSASNVKLMTGKQQEVSIALNNESEIIMIEFEMQLPSGISIAKDEDDEFLTELVSSRVAKSHTLEVADQGNGKYKFLLYSSSNAPLIGNSGDLITFTINCDKNATEGNYQAKVSSILMADKNENAIYPNDFTFDITIVDAIPGDVNDDSKINGLDIVKIVGYIMGSPTQPFIEAAADLNEDGIINGLDLVKEVSLVLTQSSTTTAGAKTIGKRGQVSASQIALENPKHGVLTLSTDDNRDYILSQMIIETSGDVTVNSITTDAKHIVAYSKVGENRYAVVCYSMTNESFVSNRDIIDIHYTGNGYINLSNVLFVDSEENEVSLGRTSFSDTTAIKEIISTVKPADVYSVTGKLVKKGAISIEGLPAGIYIVNGQKIIIK